MQEVGQECTGMKGMGKTCGESQKGSRRMGSREVRKVHEAALGCNTGAGRFREGV